MEKSEGRERFAFVDVMAGRIKHVVDPVATLLLVEDSGFKRHHLRWCFLNLGYAVDIAADGVEAVEMVSQGKGAFYDAVLMNITMPRMDGLMATEALRNVVDYKGPIIGFSVTCNEALRAKAKKVGMNDCVNYFEGHALLAKALVQQLGEGKVA